MKRIIFAISSAIILLASCAREEAVFNQMDGSFEFTLNGTLKDIDEDEPGTKGSTTAVMRLTWAVGDEISVINLTTGKALGGSLAATVEGQSSLFSGTLTGTINAGDDLAFIYPSQGYVTEQPFTGATVDLSSQEGKSVVPYCIYAKTSLSSGNVTSAYADFNFLISYVQLNLAGLPSSAAVSEVAIEDMGSELVLTIENGNLKCTPTKGTITITPSGMSTNADGARTVYFATGASSATVDNRHITATVGDDIYNANWTKASITTGKFYTSIVSSFSLLNADFDVVFAQHATVGRGIDVIFLGDGYTKSQEDMMRYEEDMLWMKDAFLSMEPFKSHEEYFNLYSTKAISNEGKRYESLTNGANDLGGDTKFSTTFTANSTNIRGDLDAVIDFAFDSITAIEGEEPSSARLNDVLVVMMINANVNAGTCWMYTPGSTSNDHASGLAIGFFARNSNERVRRATLLHEAGGHGFAKLGDEYFYNSNVYNPPATPSNDERYLLRFRYHPWGWYTNVDAIKSYPSMESTELVDNDSPSWADFLYNTISSYSNTISAEQISTYEGAYTYPNGFWRPTPNSIMYNHYVTTKFNAPSRRMIWYKIHKLADPSFVNDYSAFVAWDLAHQDQGIPLLSSGSYNDNGFNSMLDYHHEPPVVIDEPVTRSVK